MAKGVRDKIKLVSSAGTGHFYTTTKNRLSLIHISEPTRP